MNDLYADSGKIAGIRLNERTWRIVHPALARSQSLNRDLHNQLWKMGAARTGRTRMRFSTPSLIACLLFAATPHADAQDAPDEPDVRYHFAVTPFIGYQVGGSLDDKTTDAHASLNESAAEGLILDLPADYNTEYELFYLHQGTKFEARGTPTPQPSQSVDLHYLQIGGTYFGEGERVQPYIAAGLGATFLDPAAPGTGSETDFSFSIGAGARFFPASRVSLRLEGRVLGTVVAADSRVFCVLGSSGNTCLIETKADVLWQFTAFAGASIRF